jgi:hypothetical protein
MYDVFDFPLWTMPAPVVSPRLAQAFPLPQDATYIDFMGAGYTDVWSKVVPKSAGFTCCQDEADNNPVSQLSEWTWF